MYALLEVQDFLTLSASLNYQLSGTPINWEAILVLTLGNRHRSSSDELLIESLQYLSDAYGESKRRLGPFAVLHPIRAAAVLAKAMENPPLLDILTTLLHDKNEDILPGNDPEKWQHLEQTYGNLLRRLDPTDNWFLNERIECLTRRPDDRYYTYLGRLLDRARNTPELVRVKLADRLDNTLDLRIDLQDQGAQLNCAEVLFDTLFTQGNATQRFHHTHPVSGRLNGSHRLYQLFKNAVLLSLLRIVGLDRTDETSERLFYALAAASLAESQRILIHLFLYHVKDVQVQRQLLLDVMDYCQAGAITRVTTVEEPHRLDGLLKYRFDIADRNLLKERLSGLYEDKSLMAEVAIAFSAIFSSFLNDPTFRIHGIDMDGIHPMSSDEA
jgi:hypothetical protein